MLHERGLAYQEESLVNYDPVDKTVLANEQVDANGKSWRSGAQVEKRMLKQWFLKISQFRQELLDDLDLLAKDGRWPERVIAMQKNWIGKSQGANIKFRISAFDNDSSSDVQVFTTRPDTLYGVQYLALAATHPLVEKTAKVDKELQTFLTELPNLPADSKKGYLLANIRATNPLAFFKETPDATKASLPIYVAPYVLAEYGEGAVMGVPGHDTRDYAFWKLNRPDDPVRMVVSVSAKKTLDVPNGPFTHEGHLNSGSGPHAGLSSVKATERILQLLGDSGLAESAVTWRLRDWLISRQRYWGTPIPIIHCQSCGPVPVPDHDLPVVLPQVEDHWAKGKTGNPLEHAHDWINTACPKCGHAAERDTDTMDTFVDSSWYFLRYADVHNEEMMARPIPNSTFLPVDMYIGGVEHAILHLLYTRFIFKFLATTDQWPFGGDHKGEPIKRLITQGMVHGQTYSDPSSGRFLKPGEVELSKSGPVITATGEAPLVSYEKMSKSKYNGVDPSTCISKYGADATRAHILFQAPVSEVLEWDEEKISGVTRWMKRLYDHLYEWHNEAGFLAGDAEFRLLRSSGTDASAIRAGGIVFIERYLPQAFINRHHTTPKDYFLSYASARRRGSSGQPLRLVVSDPDEHDDKSIFTSGVGSKDLFKLMKQLPRDPIDHETLAETVLGDLFQDLGMEGNKESRKLWRAVQKAIRSTTASYENGYSLNTVVSDLMSLTNVMIDYPGGELGPQDRWIHYRAAMNLIKMMAPICPAFAEECWALITYRKPTWRERLWMWDTFKNISHTTTPFRETRVTEWPYPEEDGTLDMLTPDTLTCSVQINGKLKCVVELDKPDSSLRGKEVQDWIVSEVLSSPEWKEKVGRKVDVTYAKKVIVVKGGKLVNFVL
jgi:leucyl-tRNA synthetase